MKRIFRITKDKAIETLSTVLPGHQLEAFEAITLALHGLPFRFALQDIMYSLTYVNNIFEVRWDDDGSSGS